MGGSIEDYDPDGGIYDIDHAVERVAAASEAAKQLGFPFTLTARAENFFRRNPDLDDTVARLQAYERAGADVLYAPALRNVEQIRALSEATSKPLNVLARPDLSMSEIVAAGGGGSASEAGSRWRRSAKWWMPPRRCGTRATSRPSRAGRAQRVARRLTSSPLEDTSARRR